MTKAIPMRDCSLDIESLGTRPGCPVLSIGAVMFDRHTGKLGQEYYAEIDLASAIKGSTHVSASTLEWWMTKSPEARRVFTSDTRKVSLATALDGLTTFLRSVSGGVPIPWGNGATMDIAILERAYEIGSVGLAEAWHYTNIRDMRTIVDAVQHVVPGFQSLVANVGTAHNALDDAKYQALCIAEAFAVIKGGEKAVKAMLVEASKPARVEEDDDEL